MKETRTGNTVWIDNSSFQVIILNDIQVSFDHQLKLKATRLNETGRFDALDTDLKKLSLASSSARQSDLYGWNLNGYEMI